MPIDPTTETLITYEQARVQFPQRPTVETIGDWINKGVRGVKLESTPIGGKNGTSIEACKRFLAALAQAQMEK